MTDAPISLVTCFCCLTHSAHQVFRNLKMGLGSGCFSDTCYNMDEPQNIMLSEEAKHNKPHAV